MNYGLGQVFINVFLICSILSFKKISLGDIIISVMFGLISFYNIYIHCYFRNEESLRVKRKLERVGIVTNEK